MTDIRATLFDRGSGTATEEAASGAGAEAPGMTLTGTPFRPIAVSTPAETVTPQQAQAPARRRLTATARLTRLIVLCGLLSEAILALRALFAAIQANGSAAVVRFIELIGAPLVAPFAGITPNQGLGNGGTLQVDTLITMGAYLVATAVVVATVRVVLARGRLGRSAGW